jgi:hypothetical protein
MHACMHDGEHLALVGIENPNSEERRCYQLTYRTTRMTRLVCARAGIRIQIADEPASARIGARAVAKARLTRSTQVPLGNEDFML